MQCRIAIAILLGLVPAVPVGAEDSFHFGGAIRINHAWRDYGPTKGEGSTNLELFRLDSRGQRGALSYSAQYRFYNDFEAIHHAWVGYRFDDVGQLRAGVQQVPFGLLPYASQSFWFGSGYYLGIEDDYDLGLVWERGDEAVRWHAGLFFADEYGDGSRFDRYSFDVAETSALPYRERERVVLRRASLHEDGDESREWGVSAFAGRVENDVDGREHDHLGLALHARWKRDAWTFEGQWAAYRYDVPGQRIALSAFAFPFEAASEAQVLSANVVRSLPTPAWLDSLTCYNNLSTTQVSGAGRRDSWQNVTGCSIGRGPMFTYVDWIAGYNMWFIGGPGIGIDDPGGARWRSRLNINFGFYF
ncbi:porin [Pseudomarimonas salicorniae]|uniref:OprO/OprP family phosphate-selective porin n=1 Tax=Pseudomarimonas salicorniae TaxID=2933270 RepID=A0ABT0GFE0_9GAMM|nr:porin [Lysobacter sp. CAU 1642]MCK7592740.1 OprO/OprP family phosphate-selective porin [Lysobacter sp. CAU 1642]